MTVEVGVDAVDHLERGEGVDEVGGADCDRARTGEEELHRVFAGHDAAHADHRNLHRAGRFVDHAHRDRFERGAGEAAGAVGDLRLARLDVDRHGGDRVDEGDRVAAGGLDRAGELTDVGDVRTEFGDQWQKLKQPH